MMYRIEITDRDSEIYEYTLKAASIWQVTRHIFEEMNKGDFFGHTEFDTIELKVWEVAV